MLFRDVAHSIFSLIRLWSLRGKVKVTIDFSLAADRAHFAECLAKEMNDGVNGDIVPLGTTLDSIDLIVCGFSFFGTRYELTCSERRDTREI